MVKLRVWTALLWLCTASAFSPPRPAVRSPSLYSIAEEPKVNNSFESIPDDGIEIDGYEAIDNGETPSEEGIDGMLNKALQQSVDSVSDKLPSDLAVDMSNVLKDEEFQNEITKIFDQATVDLKDALGEIRKEQDEFASSSAKKSASKTKDRMLKEKMRMTAAASSMETMIDRVNKESKEVQQAVDDLQKAQNSLSDDWVMKLAKGGIVPQAALAGSLLFSIRSLTDVVAMVGGDGSHAMPALIQGALAIACVAYFVVAA